MLCAYLMKAMRGTSDISELRLMKLFITLLGIDMNVPRKGVNLLVPIMKLEIFMSKCI